MFFQYAKLAKIAISTLQNRRYFDVKIEKNASYGKWRRTLF